MTLKQLRKLRGKGQDEVAKYLEITVQALSHYETARREPSLYIVLKLSKLYNVSVSELINIIIYTQKEVHHNGGKSTQCSM